MDRIIQQTDVSLLQFIEEEDSHHNTSNHESESLICDEMSMLHADDTMASGIENEIHHIKVWYIYVYSIICTIFDRN